MRIQIVSDLHTEQDNPPPPLAPGADMITVAGDLGPVVVDEWNVAKHILYVPGNHEFFGSDADEAREILAGQCRIHAVTLLDRAAVTIEGVRFIGATLWTDFRLDGAHAGGRRARGRTRTLRLRRIHPAASGHGTVHDTRGRSAQFARQSLH